MCGISGILYDINDKTSVSWKALFDSIEDLQLAKMDASAPPYQLIDTIEANSNGLRTYCAFAQLWDSEEIRISLSKSAQILKDFENSSRQAVLDPKNHVTSQLVERWNALWVRIRDLNWSFSKDVLNNIDRVKLILPNDNLDLLFSAWKITAVLENIGRLEVRGRDSLGISLSVTFPDLACYQQFLDSVNRAGLSDSLQKRLSIATLDNYALRVYKSQTPSMLFAYKVALEVGALGDNVRVIRQKIQKDEVLWLALSLANVQTNIWSHTRWASNGIISEVNCHPVDELTQGPALDPAAPWIAAALNGDVDNYQELAKQIKATTGQSIAPCITTDAKIIPVLVNNYYKEYLKDPKNCGIGSSEDPMEWAFRKAVLDFEGSTAVVMHTSLDCNKTYLALKGSGQSLFLGLCASGYVFASELYGVVEQTNKFIRLDGTCEAVPDKPETAGQIAVIEQGSDHGIKGIKLMALDGTLIALTDEDVKTAEITTRDINRGDHSHFLLKEIFDSPNSVEKTLFGKVFLSSDKDKGETSVNLGTEVFPEVLTQRFKSGKIKRILLIGQGTAAVAGMAVASMMQRALCNTLLEVRAVKATELSGYNLVQDMSDCLILAVSQSGTTTDTNRTVDLVRSRGAIVIAIVNRRNSDLTYKVDGVLYTSDGRDIEMSVASTKAFYSQVIAGYLLGMHIALLLGAMDAKDANCELQEMVNLPQKMCSLLDSKENIRDLAYRFATTRKDWAVVGSGCTRAAADEIRIKLSELCYKSIATDFIEDKKHIDLSSEPLTLVCAAGLPLMALRDCVKEVAIFKSHKSLPIVICAEGFDEFERYAAGVIYVPESSSNCSVLLNTMVGHLWGYYCALAINEAADKLRPARALAVQHLTCSDGLLLTQSNVKRLLSIGKAFQDNLKRGRMNSSLSVESAVKLSLMFQYFTDAKSLRQFTSDFTGDSLVETMVVCLSQAIGELSRPIDAIKHQAKTITVGISRSREIAEGPLFEALKDLDIAPEDLPYRDLPLVRALTLAVDSVLGASLYEIDSLNALNEVVDSSTIKVIKKIGLAANLRSRSDSGSPLVGTKQWVVNNRRSYIGHGRNDKRPMLICPVINHGRVERLALLHLRFVKAMALAERLDMITNLTNRYGDLVSQVEEINIIWRDEFLNLLEVEELATLRAAELAELVIKRKPEEL